jgi:hypothetical protein
MQNYETKILKRSGMLSLLFVKNYSSDFAAIRAAKKFCGDGGDTVEVWRDNVCIYSEHAKPIRLVWPVCSSRG